MWISDLTSHRLRDVSEHRERRLSYVHAVKLNHAWRCSGLTSPHIGFMTSPATLRCTSPPGV